MKVKVVTIISILIGLVLVLIGGVVFIKNNEFSQMENNTSKNNVSKKENKVNSEDRKKDLDNTDENEDDEKEKNFDEMNVVLSLEDKITDDTVWCGTFNLIWNDLRDELAKQDIEFEEQTDLVDNLNKGTFTTDELDDDSYYKVYGNPSYELKAEIEDTIKEKFDEESKILDQFEWKEKPSKNDYFLYAMLKKEFKFPKEFTKLENDDFGDYEDVEYFGIDSSTDKNVRDQVEVLYYNSENDFAIKLFTKQNDEVIITKGNEEKSFGSVYDNIIEQKENYEGNEKFTKYDKLKIPNIKLDIKKDIDEVTNQPFLFSNGQPYVINTALQTIEFELDEKGGKIKSEAGIMMTMMSAEPKEEPEIREFMVDDNFVIFLKEENSKLPYFAAKITDITNVQ